MFGKKNQDFTEKNLCRAELELVDGEGTRRDVRPHPFRAATPTLRIKAPEAAITKASSSRCDVRPHDVLLS